MLPYIVTMKESLIPFWINRDKKKVTVMHRHPCDSQVQSQYRGQTGAYPATIILPQYQTYRYLHYWRSLPIK